MKLKDIKIENFRGIRSLHIPLDKLTVLIGENNTGKSTLLEAIRIVLTGGFGSRRAGQFTEYDFHLENSEATPETAKPIQITLHFAEEKEDEWPETVIQQMNEVIQIDEDGLSHIWLRAEGRFNPDSSSFETKWNFLDSKGVELVLKNAIPLNLLSRFVPIFYLSALRDASQEFGQRGRFWRGFLKSVQLPDEKREEIEEILRDVNTSVIGANAGLTEVKTKLADTGKLIPLGADDPVVLEAIPTRIFDMVGKIQVHLKSPFGAKLPLYRHGEGTQNLAVLMLFQAFVSENLAETYAPESIPLLIMEEPEAHLHPSAIRSLGSFLQSMNGQILVSSHSGDLVSRVPLTSLRRLYKDNIETKIGYVENNTFDDRELQTIDYSIRLTKGHYLFSRCWLLVEGETEFHLIPLLFEIMGYSQDQISFSVIEIGQMIKKGEPIIKLAKALGIQWFMMADGDNAGNDYINRAQKHLENGESLADRAQKLDHADIEHEFWHNGYEDFIENLITDKRKKEIESKAAGDDIEKTKLLIKAAINKVGGKPAFAQALAAEVQQRGKESIPKAIKDIITRVVELSGSIT